MKTILLSLAITLCALFALAGSAVAMIGETPKQFEPGKPVESKMLAGNVAMMTWIGKTLIHIGQFDYNNGGRCQRETFRFKDGHDMCKKPGALEKLLAPYGKLTSYDAGNDGQRGYFKMVNSSGQLVGVAVYDYDTYWLDVMTAYVWEYSERQDAEARIAAHRQGSRTPLSVPKSVPQSAPSVNPMQQQNDCLPFATEAFARLSKASVWAKIAGFTVVQGRTVMGGHAVVLFQPTEGSHVWSYDRNGSLELPTTSHDLVELELALGKAMNGITPLGLRWVERQ